MIVKKLPFNPFPVNTYVIYDEVSKECAVIDPGCYWPEERQELKSFIVGNDLKVKHLLMTHLHLDHVLAAPFVAKTFNVPFEANKKDEFQLNDADRKAAQYGFSLPEKMIPVEKDLKEGDRIRLGEQELIVIEVPGHSPGSVAFYDPQGKQVIVGDALFLGSIGRTDLPGGEYDTLIDSIRTKLFTLPEETKVLSGHGPDTNIGYERKNNPFLK